MSTRLTSLAASALRLALAAAALFVCLRQWPAVLVESELDALPDFNYLAAADSLRTQGRYGEALLVIETGYTQAPPDAQAPLHAEHDRIESERDDVVRRLREVGYGALTGRGDSVEAFTGAIAADMLVVGDVRDLLIQAARKLRGEEVDELLAALSGVGVMLTLAPEVDWSVAVLKFARRAGAVTDSFAKDLVKLARRAMDERKAGGFGQAASDFAELARDARPAGAVAILRHVDDAGTLHRAAEVAGRPGGAFALWVGEDAATGWLKAADRGGEDWLLRAGRKGRAGIELLADNSRVLLRPHPLLGVLKGVYKGNIPALLARALSTHAAALSGLIAAWFLYELLRVFARLRRAPLTR